MKILKNGTYLGTDKQGYFVNSLSSTVNEPWDKAVKMLVEECKEKLGDKLHSVYIRGSVASGRAVKGVSDIDSYVVVKGEPGKIDLDWTAQTREKVLNKFGFITKVELVFVNLENFSDQEKSFNTSFFIKTQSICVYGENLQPSLPRYKPDKNLARKLHGRWIDKNIRKAKEKIANTKDEEEVKKWCTWIAKRIVRTGFALVIDKEKKYTRDLYLCYSDFSKYYSDKENEMKTALQWAVNPISDKNRILEFLESFGNWLIKENERVLGS